ncbi:MAG: Uma2 family endonuclease, partial [Eubacterium sp.]|nr:Uma2 family endonuclease [Eubacterium sp.]
GVQLDEDEYTMLEPDLFVLCGERKKQLEAACTVGAPDLVIEVLSPSTRSKDMHIKGRKYMNAGVREYWMIDPRNKKVLIDRFSPMEGEREPDVDVSLYGFHDRIPVGIAEGACEVDFEKIWKKIAFLYAE